MLNTRGVWLVGGIVLGTIFGLSMAGLWPQVPVHAVATHGLTRVYAIPFAWNTASCRVLEKAGYVLEGRLRRSAVKDGKITDQLQYAFIP